MGAKRRPNKTSKGKSGGGGHAKNGHTTGGTAGGIGDDDDWDQIQADLDALAIQNKLSSGPRSAVPGVHTAANVAAAAAFLLYANAIVVCKFPYDDNKALRENPDVLNLVGDGTMTPFPQFWYNDFWGTPLDSPYTHKSYRPIVIQSFRWDAAITSEAWIFHLTNGLLYAACAWLVVYVLLPSTVLSAGGMSASAADRGAKQNVLLLSGLWFAAHPVHVESVAGIVGRAEILSAIFCVWGVRMGENNRNLVGAAASFAAACLCKETAVVVPAMLGAVDILASLIGPKKKKTAGGTGGGKGKETERWGRAMVFGGVSFGYLLFRSWLFGGKSTLKGALMLEDSFMQHIGPLDKFRTALFIMAKYCQLLVWPGTLSCDYGLGVIDPVTSWASPEIVMVILAGGSVLVWVTYGLYRLHKTGDESPLLAAGWAFAPLVPASHIVDIGTVMAERLAFTPTVGIAMLLCHLCGIAASSAASRPKVWRTAQAAVFAVCLWFGIRTLNRVPDWEESKTLFLADVRNHPRGVKLLDSSSKQLLMDDPALGFEYAKRAQEVTDEYRGVFKKERYATGLINMANLKVRNEQWPAGANLTEALEYANEIIEIGPEAIGGEDGMTTVYTIKGTAYFRLGRPTLDQDLFEKAIENFKIAVKFDNSQRGGRTLYCEYATCLAQAGRKEEAYDVFGTCFEREIDEDLKRADFQNYAILMKELAGVDIEDNREAAIAAAREWGDRALEVIDKYMDHEEFPESHKSAWVKVTHEVKLLQTGIDVPMEEMGRKD